MTPATCNYCPDCRSFRPGRYLKVVSYIPAILFNLAVVLTFESNAGDIPSDPLPNYRLKTIEFMASIHQRLPQGESGNRWSGYRVGGVSIAVPTTNPIFELTGSVETGTLEQNNYPDGTPRVIHSMAGLRLFIPLIVSGLGLEPSIALSNMTVFNVQGGNGQGRISPFGGNENEFGAQIGLAPCLRLGHVVVRLPFDFDCVFSSPLLFISTGIGLCVGGYW